MSFIHVIWLLGMLESDKTKERKFAGGLALPETVKIIDEEKMRWFYLRNV